MEPQRLRRCPIDIIVDNTDLKIERLELSSYPTNAYIVICPRTGKSALIDAPAGARTIVKNLKGTQLELILLTHSHIYHTQGLRAIRKMMTAALAVHENDNQRWLPFRPDMTLNDKDILTIGKVKIEAIYTPGHTPGSMCFRIGKYLMAGDTLLSGGPGKTTDPKAFQLIIKSITEELFILPDDMQVYPGHGGPADLKRAKEEYRIFASHQHSPNLCGDVRWVTS